MPPALRLSVLTRGCQSLGGTPVQQLAARAGDSLQFDATVLHGIEANQTQPVSYLFVVFTLRE